MNVYRKENRRGMVKRVKWETKGREAQRLLAEVAEDRVFRCHDGQVLKSLKDLSNAFSVMTNETFGYHWSTAKKDISNWVRDIIGDVNLAKDLERATSRSLAAWEVATRIAYLARQVPYGLL
jgi:hypothetical protein